MPPRKSLELWPNASTVSLISLSDINPDSPEPEGVEWMPLSIPMDSDPPPVRQFKISADDESTCPSSSIGSSASLTHRMSLAMLSPEESTQIGDRSTLELIPVPKFRALEEKMLYMQLYRAVGNVFAIKEAMWEELKERALRGDQALRKYGWVDNDYKETNCRARFELLYSRYKEYVRLHNPSLRSLSPSSTIVDDLLLLLATPKSGCLCGIPYRKLDGSYHADHRFILQNLLRKLGCGRLFSKHVRMLQKKISKYQPGLLGCWLVSRAIRSPRPP